MTFKSFVAILIVSVLTSGAIAFISVSLTKASTSTAEPVKEYVEIGNGIKRTDDNEKGVSCYVWQGSRLSCVKVIP